MSDEHNPDFDLKALLLPGDLDIRSIIAAKTSMTVGEYFYLVAKFIKLAPSVSGALAQIAGRGGDKKAADSLADISIIMNGIGCNKLIREIDSIVAACNKNNMEFAADCAKNISEDFNGLYNRIMSAKKNTKPEAVSAFTDSDDMEPDKNAEMHKLYALKEAVKDLDDAEAGRKLRIVAVDDSPVILKIVSSILNDYEVYTLARPTLLEKFLHKITPELFILDYKMPELSGFDLIPIIRSFDEHKDTPIIFLTSEGTLDNLSAAVMLGACDFVVKPVRPEILREKIATHIVRKKSF